MPKKTLLVTTDLIDPGNLERLSRYARVSASSTLGQEALIALLPSVDAMMIFSWPKFMTEQVLVGMPRLRFIQSILAGVNHIPFKTLNRRVVVASNAGAYSGAVAEYAWALLLSAAKRIVEHHVGLREGSARLVRHGDAAEGVYMLEGKTLGILGFGGIGRMVARLSQPLKMRVLALARTKTAASGVNVLTGRRGLERILKESDATVIALPLTKQTTHIINKSALSKMREHAILVNIARGELVDENAVYNHLKSHPGFRFATDVWWYRDNRESLETNHDFASLPNFIGTPHVSGPSGLATGLPIKVAVDNTLRFLMGKTPENIVDRSEYG